jgi:hypothetical protein
MCTERTLTPLTSYPHAVISAVCTELHARPTLHCVRALFSPCRVHCARYRHIQLDRQSSCWRRVGAVGCIRTDSALPLPITQPCSPTAANPLPECSPTAALTQPCNPTAAHPLPECSPTAAHPQSCSPTAAHPAMQSHRRSPTARVLSNRRSPTARAPAVARALHAIRSRSTPSVHSSQLIVCRVCPV